MKITTLVYKQGFSANTHLLYLTNSEIVAFDLGQSTDSFARYLKNHELSLRAVFLTHGHFDHIAFVDNIPENIPVYIHYADRELLTNPYKNCSNNMWNPIKCKRKIIDLQDSDIIKIGSAEIKVINTPFHTMGSSMFLINESYLISGDTLFKGSIGRSDLPTSSPRLMPNSLKKIISLYKEYGDLKVYPGHGENTTLRHEIGNNYYLKNIN